MLPWLLLHPASVAGRAGQEHGRSIPLFGAQVGWCVADVGNSSPIYKEEALNVNRGQELALSP
jgi:hypothetical protein